MNRNEFPPHPHPTIQMKNHDVNYYCIFFIFIFKKWKLGGNNYSTVSNSGREPSNHVSAGLNITSKQNSPEKCVNAYQKCIEKKAPTAFDVKEIAAWRSRHNVWNWSHKSRVPGVMGKRDLNRATKQTRQTWRRAELLKQRPCCKSACVRAGYKMLSILFAFASDKGSVWPAAILSSPALASFNTDSRVRNQSRESVTEKRKIAGRSHKKNKLHRMGYLTGSPQEQISRLFRECSSHSQKCVTICLIVI